MPLILFDVNVHPPFSRFLTGHSVAFADERGWRELTNRHILSAAETAGFDVLLTADLNLRYQQNLAGRRISIVALSTNRWGMLRVNPSLVTDAIDRARAGTYEEAILPRPALRRPRDVDRSP